MRQDFESGVFGTEKDGSFKSSVSQISKSLRDEDFLFSLEEKEAGIAKTMASQMAISGLPQPVFCCF
jgi:hypothetical protein